jgi:dUTP pyrophosphatase
MIRVKKLKDNAILPTRGSASAAGYDLYAAEGAFIPAGKTVMVGTGLAMEIPNGFWGGVYARSGLATKQGLRPANCVGVIDSDYRGEIIVALHNDSDSEKVVQAGDRIAQLVFHHAIVSAEVDGQSWEVVDDLDNTDRGDGGFGSTGSN